MEDQIPKEVVQDRFERLVALQDSIQAEENEKLVGTEVELLVQAEGGRKNDETHRMSGRARDGRLVHFSPIDDNGADISAEIRPGDVVRTKVTGAGSFFLLADAAVSAHTRTKAGDMSAAGQTPLPLRSGWAWDCRASASLQALPQRILAAANRGVG